MRGPFSPLGRTPAAVDPGVTVRPASDKSISSTELLQVFPVFCIGPIKCSLELMSRRWILKCRECRAEYTYEVIGTTGIADYFLPKRPQVPPNFQYACPVCNYKDTYDRSDLIYLDDAAAPNPASAKSADGNESGDSG
jgi:hypothetical protein